MTSPTQRKPSGYAAWHPEFGYLRSSLADRRELVEYESCTKADQREEQPTPERKPDGWCAYHPDKGWLKGYELLHICQTFEGALEELQEALREDFDKASCAHDPRLNLGLDFVPWAREQGWQIRPVWLSTEPPREWKDPKVNPPTEKCTVVVLVGRSLHLARWDGEKFWDWGMPGTWEVSSVLACVEVPERSSPKKEKEPVGE